MDAAEADWRLTSQDQYLSGASLVRKRYRVSSEDWEHDHCAFCWAKFMDPGYSDEHRAFVAENPETLTEGYTTTAEHPSGADYHWVCPGCFDDFADAFRWRVVSA